MSTRSIQPGDHVYVKCIGFTHHGVATGEGTVIEFEGKFGDSPSGRVVESSIEEFSGGRKIYIRKHSGRPYSGAEIVSRARSRIGESGYNLIFNNCEHFVNECIDGEAKSPQVQTAAQTLTGGGTTAIASRAAWPFRTGKPPIYDGEIARNLATATAQVLETRKNAEILTTSVSALKTAATASSAGKAAAVAQIAGGAALATKAVGAGSLATTTLSAVGITALAPIALPVAGVVAIGAGIWGLFRR